MHARSVCVYAMYVEPSSHQEMKHLDERQRKRIRKRIGEKKGQGEMGENLADRGAKISLLSMPKSHARAQDLNHRAEESKAEEV